GYVLVGGRGFNGVVVCLVHRGGIIEYLQVLVAHRDQGIVYRQIEGRDPVGIRTPVYHVVAQRQVVPYTNGGEELKLELEWRYPDAARYRALQAHPNGNPARAQVCCRVRDFSIWKPRQCIRKARIVIFNWSDEVRGVLVAQNALVLKGQIEQSHAVAVLVTANERIRKRGHQGLFRQGDHAQLQFHNGETGQCCRGDILFNAREYDLAKGVDIGVGEQYFGSGNAGYGFRFGFVVGYGNVGLPVFNIIIGKGGVPSAHDPIIIVVTEFQWCRVEIGVRVRKHLQGKLN